MCSYFPSLTDLAGEFQPNIIGFLRRWQPVKWLIRRLARVQYCKKQGKQFD